MPTEYRVRLDRAACDGVFACLVRDERFEEASDGLATLENGTDDEDRVGDEDPDERANRDGDEEVVSFVDDDLAAAEQAARACPVDAIEVLTGEDDE